MRLWQQGGTISNDRWGRLNDKPLPRRPPSCTTCAPVLGFQQPVAELTHAAIGLMSEGRNSINKTQPSTRCTMLQERRWVSGWTICSFLYRAPPVTCQSVPLMPNTSGHHSYSLNHLRPALCNEAVTQLALVYRALQSACICLPQSLGGPPAVALEPFPHFRWSKVQMHFINNAKKNKQINK